MRNLELPYHKGGNDHEHEVGEVVEDVGLVERDKNESAHMVVDWRQQRYDHPQLHFF